MVIPPTIMISVEIKPTENPIKVRKAVINIFPDVVFEEFGHLLLGKSSSLERFRQLVKEQKIRDSVRSYLYAHRYGNKLVFYLNKEVAYIGKVNMAEEGEHALGEIRVEIRCNNVAEIIDYITAKP